jgi:schlafen family protein
VVTRIRTDAEFAALVAEQLGFSSPALRTIEELLENDEDDAVEFKSTARWDLREDTASRLMEDAAVKTVAGFLNSDGGTLLIGVGPDRQPIGLDHDYQRVKPPNGDGFVNWLTTHLINALDHTAASHVRARIVEHAGVEICRIDVGRSPRPLIARISTKEAVFSCGSTTQPGLFPSPNSRRTSPNTGLRIGSRPVRSGYPRLRTGTLASTAGLQALPCRGQAGRVARSACWHDPGNIATPR